jgi:hypothetical protein
MSPNVLSRRTFCLPDVLPLRTFCTSTLCLRTFCPSTLCLRTFRLSTPLPPSAHHLLLRGRLPESLGRSIYHICGSSLPILREAELRINPANCILSAAELDFLGHRVSSASTSAPPSPRGRPAAISAAHIDIESLYWFLGLVNYFDIFSVRHYLPTEILSHSAFITFDLMSFRHYFPFAVLSFRRFFYHSTFILSTFCPIQPLVRRRFFFITGVFLLRCSVGESSLSPRWPSPSRLPAAKLPSFPD